MLILLVSAPLFFSVGFIIKQKNIQAGMKLRLKTALLQTVTVSAKEVKWIKPEKEIFVKGKMFDVKTSTPSGDKIIFTGLYDEDEQKLHKSLKDFIINKNKRPSPQDHLFAKFFSLTATEPVSTEYNLGNREKGLLIHPFLTDKIPPSPGFSIYQPPRI